MNEQVFVATFHRIEPAKHLRSRLEQQGILSTINDQTRVERFWMMSKPLAAYHTEVHRDSYLEARRLVDEWEKTDPQLQGMIHCPQCHSGNLEYPQLPRKFMLPAIIGNLMTAIGVMPRECYCKDCHHTWPLEPVPVAPGTTVPVRP